VLRLDKIKREVPQSCRATISLLLSHHLVGISNHRHKLKFTSSISINNTTRELVPSGHTDAGSASSPNSEDTRKDSSGPQGYQSPSERPRFNKRPRHNGRPYQGVPKCTASPTTNRALRLLGIFPRQLQAAERTCGLSLKPSAFQLTRIHRMDTAVVDVHRAARWVPRLIGLFLNVRVCQGFCGTD